MRSVVAAFAALAALAGCAASGDGAPSATGHLVAATLVFDGTERLHVRVADTASARAEGLMNVTSLRPDDGMAFVWTEATTGTFWMKDTLIPLSIAFVGLDGKIVSTTEMQPCAADPCPTYAAPAPYLMAVEANTGWFADHGIGAGDRVRWLR
jgi:uncharacterized protein